MALLESIVDLLFKPLRFLRKVRRAAGIWTIAGTLEGIVFSAAMGIASLFPARAKATDVLLTQDIPTSTVLDRDGDGLTNNYEATIGTNPDNPDHDGDCFLDGVEAVNPGADGNPLSDTQPDIGNKLYQFGKIQNLTTGTTQSAINPVWLLGGRIAYIEANPDFTSGSIFVKNIYNMSEPRTGPIVEGLDAELRELCGGPLGLTIYYHKKDGTKDKIYRVPITGGTSIEVLKEGATEYQYSARNPSLAFNLRLNETTLETSGPLWLIAETDNPTTTTGQIYGFKLETSGLRAGLWDSSTTPVKITNFPNRTARPKVSRDGDKIMFIDVSPTNVVRLMIYQGLQDVLSGATLPFVTENELRGTIISNPGFYFPAGFGGKNNFVYWARDPTNNYTLTNPFNFNNSDFDLYCAPVGVNPATGRFSTLHTPMRLPLPGNQITASVSREGSRLAFADDYLADGALGGNFNAYATRVNTKFRGAHANPGTVYRITHPDGTEFYVGGLTSISFPSLPHVISIESLLNPISDATSGSSIITNIRTYGPSGTTFNDSTTTYTGMRGTLHYGVEDLKLPDGRTIDENTLRIQWYNPSTGQFEDNLEKIPWQQLSTQTKTIIHEIKGFSDYGIGGRFIELPQPLSAKNWGMYK